MGAQSSANGAAPRRSFVGPLDLGAPVKVTLDGVELSPRGAGLERLQFLPSSPPSLGPHELTLIVDTEGILASPAVFEQTVRFEVIEPAPFEAHGDILAVTRYPLPYREGSLPDPYLEATAGDCSARSVPLAPLCLDHFPEALIRVDLRLDPDALGYVVGNYLLPADCEAFVFHNFWEAPSATDSVIPLVPTGLREPVPFTGTQSEIEYTWPPGTYRDEPPGWCTMSFGAPSEPAAWLSVAGLSALWGIRRARSRPAKRRRRGMLHDWRYSSRTHQLQER